MAAKLITFTLDSFALLAHLEDEAGGHRVKAILAQAAKQRAEILLSLINYGEVVYTLAQERQATLLTADPEFRTVESLVSIEWLPTA